MARGRQRQNQYGFLIRPVYIPRVYDGRNKTFFFFNWEELDNHGVVYPNGSIPTDLQTSGNFSQTFTSTGALITIYDPTTTVPSSTTQSGYSRTPFAGNIIPANRIDPIMRHLQRTIRNRRSPFPRRWESTGRGISLWTLCRRSISRERTRPSVTRTGSFSGLATRFRRRRART